MELQVRYSLFQRLSADCPVFGTVRRFTSAASKRIGHGCLRLCLCCTAGGPIPPRIVLDLRVARYLSPQETGRDAGKLQLFALG